MTRKTVILTGAALAAVGLGVWGYVKRAVLKEKAQEAKNYLQGKAAELQEHFSLTPEFADDEDAE